MIGTLTLTIINEFILYFNKTVTKKYSEKKKTTTYIEPELKSKFSNHIYKQIFILIN